jgi:hypothetical protein
MRDIDPRVMPLLSSLASISNMFERFTPIFPAISANGTRSASRTARSNPQVAFFIVPALRNGRISTSSRPRANRLSFSRISIPSLTTVLRSLLHFFTSSLIHSFPYSLFPDH